MAGSSKDRKGKSTVGRAGIRRRSFLKILPAAGVGLASTDAGTLIGQQRQEAEQKVTMEMLQAAQGLIGIEVRHAISSYHPVVVAAVAAAARHCSAGCCGP